MSRPARILGWLLGTLAALALVAIAAAWLALRASLPELSGEAALPGLSAPVAVERDAAGVPVIRGRTRIDVARATGYVHAQDRLFQMDLLRRTGAGELAALLGAGLLDADRRIRLHQFRKRAREGIAALDPSNRELLEAYAEGVNAGIASLRSRPFEYLLLRQHPARWHPEDSALVIYAMWIDLQGLDDHHEQQNGRLAAVLPESAWRFLLNPDAETEAPLDGSRLEQTPFPDPAQYDLRKLGRPMFERLDEVRETLQAAVDGDLRGPTFGSNNWAVSDARTAGGAALIANDMHLGLNVPNIWYRARLVVPSQDLDVTGVMLPGVPAIVTGSNRSVAWGFTNSYGDFQDLVRIEPGPVDGTYLTAEGPRRFETDTETLTVAHGDPEELRVKSTIWGPVIGTDGEGRELALAWTAHRAGATDMGLVTLERSRNLDEATSLIGGGGMPAQNVMIADAAGRIGWVLSGKLPRRQGVDAIRPSAWHEPSAGWQGWHPAAESPRRLDPPQGYAWSANARVIGGEDLDRVGDGGYAAAARARQIRDRLAELDRATPADMLELQLDDRAAYVAKWQPLCVRALRRAGKAEAESLVRGWSGRAAIDDAGYRLLRNFELQASESAFQAIAAPAITRWPEFEWRAPERFTDVALRMIQARPPHLLDPRYPDWDAWLADIAVRTVERLPDVCATVSTCTWGKVNVATIQHPMSKAIPLLSGVLDMRSEPLPGDWSVPRVQTRGFGASERFAVSPGRESEGYFHMPGGQSGHPLSPFYRAGHADWAAGRAAPFLPGPAAHVLTLAPDGA